MTTPTQSKMAPTFINSEKESDPFLKKTKEQLEKKWSVTTMDSLFKITDLAYFLVALGRVDEAKEIGSFLAKTSPFTGNFNLWTPVGHAILLHSHLLRMEGKETEARNFLKPVLENPVSKPLPQEYAEQKLAKIHASIELARKDKVKKASCQEMARNIYALTLHMEMANADDGDYDWVPKGEIEKQWKQAIAQIGERIRSMHVLLGKT